MHEAKQLNNNFGTDVPQCGAACHQDQGSELRAECEPRPAVTFKFPWLREDAETLHRLFTRVETRREQGLSLDKALRRRWHGRHYHAAPRVRVRRSAKRLRQLYYHWLKNGKSAQCLALRFGSKLPPVPLETARAFVMACAVEGVVKFSQAVRLADTGGHSCRRLFSALPEQALRSIRETFVARRQAEIEASKLVRQHQAQMRRRLAADAARSRRLKSVAEGLV